MKFILTMSLCSFVNNQCLPPVQIQTEYNSWKDCTISALKISEQLLNTQTIEDVNAAQLATKYMCTPEQII